MTETVKKKFKYLGESHTVNVPVELLTPENEKKLKQYLADEVVSRQYQNKVGDVWEFIKEAGNATGIPRAIELSGEANRGGQALMSTGLEKFKDGEPFEGAWNMFLGLMGITFAPFEGGARSMIGIPAAEGVRMAGGPEGAAKFTEELGTMAGMVGVPGAWAKRVSELAKRSGVDVSGLIALLAGNKSLPATAAAPLSRTADELSPVPDVPTGALPDSPKVPMDTTTPGTVERLSLRTTEDLVFNPTLLSRVEYARKQAGANDERFFETFGRILVKALDEGELDAVAAVRAARAQGIKDEDLPRMLMQATSEHGGGLNIWSQAVRKLTDRTSDLPPQVRAEMLELAKNLERQGDSESMNAFMRGFRKVENFARASMVGQAATAMRNALSQTGRLSLGILDDAMRGAMEGTTWRGSVENVWNSLKADARALPLIRDKNLLNHILDGNPVTKDMLLNRSVQEVDAIGKVASYVNSLNILQEKMFRRMAFQAKLEKTLKQSGMDVRTMDPEKIPIQALEEAVDHALQISFAHPGPGWAQSITKVFEKVPVLYWAQPFPRFAYGNAIPFMLEHSPYGLLKALSPKTVSELASGNTKQFTKQASRGLLGTLMMGKAMEIRNDPDRAGENWYEYKLDDGTMIDLRSFAPLTQYLFIAEALKGKEGTIRPRDVAEAVVGMNRIAGTGLQAVEWIQARDAETVYKGMSRLFGELLGRFTIPLRTVEDLRQGITGGDIRLDARMEQDDRNLVSPTLKNIPWVGEQYLPEQQSPLREGTGQAPLTLFGVSIPAPISRQLMGISLKQKTAVESEVDRLKLDYTAILPKTGQRDIDRHVMDLMTPMVLKRIPAMMNSNASIASLFPVAEDWVKDARVSEKIKDLEHFDPGKSYKELNDEGKAIALRIAFAVAKSRAKKFISDKDKARAEEASRAEYRKRYAISRGWQPAFPQ